VVALFALLPFLSTTLGGLLVLRLRHRIHPVMGFAAGVVMATALADLLPEASELVGNGHAVRVGGLAVAGYLVFAGLEALLHRESWEHRHDPAQDPAASHEHEAAGSRAAPRGSVLSLAGSLGLIVHSTLDGLAIGLGFQASDQVGVLVALAVVAHDVADGINVVTLALAGGHTARTAVIVLVMDAVAPVVGAVVGSTIAISDQTLGLLLAGFAGVFIAIGAGHLVPEAQHQRPGQAPRVIAFAALGAALVLLLRSIVA
jgi:zinc transporter, ZIP family